MDSRDPSLYSVEGCICALEMPLLLIVSGIASLISLVTILLLS